MMKVHGEGAAFVSGGLHIMDDFSATLLPTDWLEQNPNTLPYKMLVMGTVSLTAFQCAS